MMSLQQSRSYQLSNDRPKEEDFIVTELGPFDVLVGRGTGPNKNQGNVKFRALVKATMAKYSSVYGIPTAAQTKFYITRDVVALIKALDGRFVRKLSKEEVRSVQSNPVLPLTNKNHYYVIVSDAMAVEKTKQSIRFQLNKQRLEESSNTKIKIDPTEEEGAQKNMLDGGGKIGCKESELQKTDTICDPSAGLIPHTPRASNSKLPSNLDMENAMVVASALLHDSKSSSPSIARAPKPQCVETRDRVEEAARLVASALHVAGGRDALLPRTSSVPETRCRTSWGVQPVPSRRGIETYSVLNPGGEGSTARSMLLRSSFQQEAITLLQENQKKEEESSFLLRELRRRSAQWVRNSPDPLLGPNEPRVLRMPTSTGDQILSGRNSSLILEGSSIVAPLDTITGRQSSLQQARLHDEQALLQKMRIQQLSNVSRGLFSG